MEVIPSTNTGSSGLPFSAGLKTGGFVFLSGQGGFSPATGKLVDDTIEGQTEQTVDNIAALLAQAGCGLRDVVSCAVHLSDLALFPRFNAVYARRFGEPRPVRTTVGASLVLGMLVELTVVARARD